MVANDSRSCVLSSGAVTYQIVSVRLSVRLSVTPGNPAGRGGAEEICVRDLLLDLQRNVVILNQSIDP